MEAWRRGESMTTFDSPVETGKRPSPPSQRGPFRPIIPLAVVGGLYISLEAYVLIKWVSGPNLHEGQPRSAYGHRAPAVGLLSLESPGQAVAPRRTNYHRRIVCPVLHIYLL